MMNSLIMRGMPKKRIQPMYTRMKRAPPLSAVWLGKRQILPSPTAEPAAAATIPILDAKVTLFSVIAAFA
jgi:hypothetical protein